MRPQLTWIGYLCRWLKSSVLLVALLRQLTLPLPGSTRNCLKSSSSTITCAASLWHGRSRPVILGFSLRAIPSMLSRLDFQFTVHLHFCHLCVSMCLVFVAPDIVRESHVRECKAFWDSVGLIGLTKMMLARQVQRREGLSLQDCLGIWQRCSKAALFARLGANKRSPVSSS